MHTRPYAGQNAQGREGCGVQFAAMIPWLMLAVHGAGRTERRKITAAVLSGGLILSMAGQLFLLWQDGLLNLSTGLPLHICGMMAVLSLPMLWMRPGRLLEMSLYIGMPCALMALLFPAVIHCSRPLLMAGHFNRLHGLILCCGAFAFLKEKTLPGDGKTAFLLGSVYLWGIWFLNPVLGSNYLFLRAVPAGTPLVWLMEKGQMCLLFGYEMLAMVMIRLLRSVYETLTFAGSRRAYSRSRRYSLPCTSLRRAPVPSLSGQRVRGSVPDRRKDPA